MNFIEWELLENPMDICLLNGKYILENNINLFNITFKRNEDYELIGILNGFMDEIIGNKIDNFFKSIKNNKIVIKSLYEDMDIIFRYNVKNYNFNQVYYTIKLDILYLNMGEIDEENLEWISKWYINGSDLILLRDPTYTLENGSKYTGEMLPRILKDSTQVVTCLITLKGYEAIKAEITDVTEQYFLDAWGSTYVESAQAWLANYLQCELESVGKKRTYMWSPGQHKFDLSNQKVVFDILQPEEEGCTLNESYMMSPVKTGSGIWGVLDVDAKDLLLPCDYCELAEKCPSAKTGCAET